MSKSAMQELIPELIKLRGFGIEITDEYIQGLLEKEKEQLYHSFYAGGGVTSIQDYFEQFTEYYNKTYNQNK